MAERRYFTSKVATALRSPTWAAAALTLGLVACSNEDGPDVGQPVEQVDAAQTDADSVLVDAASNDDGTQEALDAGPAANSDDTPTSTDDTADDITDAGSSAGLSDAATADRPAEAAVDTHPESGVPQVTDPPGDDAGRDASADDGSETDPVDAAVDIGPDEAGLTAIDASLADAEPEAPPGSAFPEFDGGSTRQFVEVENNNALTVANDLGHGSAQILGTLYPTSEVDIFKLQLLHPTHLTVRVRDTSDDPDVIGCEEFAMDVDLLNAAGSEVVNGVGTDACPYFDSRLQNNARGIAPGLYYLRVRASTSKPKLDEYRLDISYDSECGDGVLQGEETCDSSEACNECQRVPTCGDGFVDLPSEGCEDSGPDDGCDAQCQREFISEIEPNDSPEDALARATDDALVVSADALLGGSLQSPDERDDFVVSVAQDSILFVSVFDTPSGAGCVEAPRIQTSLYDMQDTSLRGYWPFKCAAFAANVPAGEHVLSVSDPLGSASFDTHRVEVDFVELLGAEVEPDNNTPQGATEVRPQVPFGAVAFTASVSDVDYDWYFVEVPGRHELLVDTLPDDPNLSRCASEDRDTGVVVYDSTGAQLASNSIADDGSYCGKVKVLNRLPETQRFDVQVLSDAFWTGEFDYRIVFKTRHAAP